MTSSDRPPRRRPPRGQPRLRVALGALVSALTIAVAASVSPAPRPDGVAAVGSLGTSMVEMLGQETGTNPVSLATLRSDVFAWGLGLLGDGSGVDVALIDTGVAPVDGLDGADKVLHGPDLSFEGSSPDAAFLDTYGHGTHMAGIIAGRRAGAEGIATGARIVSVKTAGHDGLTTVPQVVAAIDWAVEHRNSDGLNIRVINLSLGQAGVPSHIGDHLSAAVERAWQAGIVVVVAAGNDGDTQSHLDSPAIDPYVIAVGAVDSSLKPFDKTGRGVPAWSATGAAARFPDLVAQGRSIASYRVPGSTIDEAAPKARLGDALFLGSGTSQSAAVTSGVAAALLSVHPELRPDDVKATLEGRTFPLNHVDAARQGSGHLDGSSAVGNYPIWGVTPQSFPTAAGAGTGIVTPTGGTWSGGTWSGGTWSGATWSGATWSGGTWSGATWSGATWSGATWSGATWSGATWSGATWSGATWSGATWSGATWSGHGWDVTGGTTDDAPPATDTPADTPVAEAPAEPADTPVAATPDDTSSAQVDEATVDEAPVDEAPVDEAPVDSTVSTGSTGGWTGSSWGSWGGWGGGWSGWNGGW